MPRIHFRPCVSALLGSAVLLGSALPANALPLYHADGSIAYILGGQLNDLGSYSLDLGVQAGGQVNYDEPGVHVLAASLAEGYGVHSSTYSQLILPSAGDTLELVGSSTASATFSDVIVSGPSGNVISTSINLDLLGSTIVASSAAAGSLGFASSTVAVSVYVNGAFVGSGNHNDLADTRFGVSTSSNGMLSSWGTGANGIVTPSFNVQSGVPFEVRLKLQTSADTVGASTTGTGMSAEANADFSHTFTFALTGSVFNLPGGYTVDSADAHIVANQVVPEPSSVVVLGCGAISLFAVARRRRKRF